MLFPSTKRKRILFFIAGEAPTKEESAAAEALGTKAFRNARYVSNETSLEPCDAVAGAVPPAYAKFPVAKAEQAVASNEPVPPAKPEPEATPDVDVEPVPEQPAKKSRKR